MSTAASRKFLSQVEIFVRSNHFGELVEDGAVFNQATFQTALQLWVTSGGLKGVPTTSKAGSKKASVVDGPTCCARTYNGGGDLDGKICGRKGTVMIDGIPCCPQHSKPYPGNFKGFPDKKHIVGFCSGCSALAGKDVIHDCSQIFLLGFKSQDPQMVCQPVCISRAQQHTDYQGERIGDDKPKSTRGRKKGSGGSVAKAKPEPEPHHQEQEPENESDQEETDQVANDNQSDHSGSDEEEQEGSEWVELECDLGTGDGDQTYWGKEVSEGYEVYTYDEEDDRELIGNIDSDGVFTPA